MFCVGSEFEFFGRLKTSLKITISVESFSEIVFISQAEGGRSHPEKCAAELGMVFTVLRVYKFTIKHVQKGVLLDWKPLNSVKAGNNECSH